MAPSSDPPPARHQRAKPIPNAPPRRPPAAAPSLPPAGALNIKTDSPSYSGQRHRRRKSNSSSIVFWIIGGGVVAVCLIVAVMVGVNDRRTNQNEVSLFGDGVRVAKSANDVEEPLRKTNDDSDFTAGSLLPDDLKPDDSAQAEMPYVAVSDERSFDPPRGEQPADDSGGVTFNRPSDEVGSSRPNTATPGIGGGSATAKTEVDSLPPNGPANDPAAPGESDTPATTAPDAPVVEPSDPDANPPTTTTPTSKIVALYTDDRKTLFSRKGYPQLRKIFSEQFEQENADAIRTAFATDYDAMQMYLSENKALKETFYTAIRERDNIRNALALMNQLRTEFSDQIATYGQLAIAIAVVWDEPGRGIYDFRGHAKRCKSKMPDEPSGAIENFDYLVRFDRKLNKRIRYLPWEFLVLLVNHRTPEEERMWAVKNYFSKRQMFGDCYHDVPYDYVMLNSQSHQAALNGKPYTLPNIRENGGVCSMQADFASRVGKSIGVPAAYVQGPSTSGERHAWVMWVELTGANSNSVTFRLESHGRYRYDKYYVGQLNDPQTGEKITDRTLELRLQLVGMDSIGRRHADLLMKALPIIRENEELDAAELLDFLRAVIKISPGNEAAWTAIAQMSRDGILNKKQHGKQIGRILDSLFNTFRNLPDFTWEIFDDLVSFAESPDEKIGLYGRLVQLYEKIERPDLACEARLKLTDYLTEAKRHGEAVDGLAATIMKFPDEGRYVPRMLDRVEQICEAEGGDQKAVLRFYLNFLPKVPQKRGNDPNKYCVQMFERAIVRFQKAEQPQVVRKLENELAKVKGGRGDRE